jgi:phosphonate transport system substrate-binding protein
MRLAFLLSIVLLLLAACEDSDDTAIIHLSDLQPLPAYADSEIIPLRISVAAIISPKGTAESYQPLVDYLSQQLNRPVELVQRRTYVETNRLLKDGEVDLAFVCSGAYIIGHEEFGMELLAAPQVNGELVYHALLIVPADSPAESMVDLRGQIFAFTDPTSFTGRVYPTYQVHELGSTSETFFSRTFFTYNHDNAIRAVAEGLADGASVDSLVYEFALQRDPSLADRVKVIATSPAFAIPPVVVSPNIRPQLRATLQTILLEMDTTSDGQHILAALGIEKFVPIEDTAYDPIREIVDDVGVLLP